MPTIEQSLKSNLDLRGYTPATPPTLQAAVPVSTANLFLRCPVPPISTPSVDNLDQFNRNGQIPQFRVFQGS